MKMFFLTFMAVCLCLAMANFSEAGTALSSNPTIGTGSTPQLVPIGTTQPVSLVLINNSTIDAGPYLDVAFGAMSAWCTLSQSVCTLPDANTIYSFPATGTGKAGTSCAGTTFNIVPAGHCSINTTVPCIHAGTADCGLGGSCVFDSGSFGFVPATGICSGTTTSGSFGNTACTNNPNTCPAGEFCGFLLPTTAAVPGANCEVDFNVTVLSKLATDADPTKPGFQTFVGGSGNGIGVGVCVTTNPPTVTTTSCTGTAGTQGSCATGQICESGAQGLPAAGTGTNENTVPFAQTLLTKTPSPASGCAPLDVTYTYSELNNGQDLLSNVTLTDDLCSPVNPTLKADLLHNIGDANDNLDLDPGETWTFTCSHTFNTAGTFTNHATSNATDVVTGTAAPVELAQATVTVTSTSLVTQSSLTGSIAPPVNPINVTDNAIITFDPASFLTTNPASGSVTFSLCGPTVADTPCTSNPIFSSTVPFSNQTTSPATITSGTFQVTSNTATGHYCWSAAYAANAPWCNASSTATTNECFEIQCTPQCTVHKSVTPTTSKVGDSVTYSLGPICNTGTCPLDFVSCNDTVTGNCLTELTNACGTTLAVGACCVPPAPGTPFATKSHTIGATDPDPLVNTITVSCSGGGATASCSASATVDLVHPNFTVSKVCDPHNYQVGQPLTWTVDLTNTGDVDLNICCTDPIAGINNECQPVTANGGTAQITKTGSPTTECTSITNTVTCTATLPPALNLDNVIGPKTASDTCSCSVALCRMTGGHVHCSPGQGCTTEPGLATACSSKTTEAKGAGPKADRPDVPFYTTGGQIGAPNASGCCDDPPTTNGRGSDCPWGNWEHNHHSGSDESGHWSGGSFAFHSGTAAAPPEAFIHKIICTDPGWCVQARPAPFEQITWDGTGVFHVLDGEFDNCSTATVFDKKTGGSIHYYIAHVADYGEPAGNKQKPANDNPDCAAWKECATAEPLSIVECALASPFCDIAVVPDTEQNTKHPLCPGEICTDCPDFYEIQIYCGDSAANKGNLIYSVRNYICGGNFQIHPEVGSNCNFNP